MDINRFEEITNQFQEKTILVIGDFMLDEYYWGSTSRISPEAPVPIVDVERIETTAGGAGNVVLNLAKMDAKVKVVGVIGKDNAGDELINLFKANAIDTGGFIIDPRRLTTVKTRIIAQNQQILRTDRENKDWHDPVVIRNLIDNLEVNISGCDAVIIADYNKGLLTADVIEHVLSTANRLGVPVYVDPKFDNFFSYQQVRLFKPNTKEFLTAVNTMPSNEQEFLELGDRLHKKLQAEVVMVTRGQDGITVFHDNMDNTIPTKARKVHDVSGAGDTVIAVFTLADLSGATVVEAAEIANLAAGRVCAEVGAVPVDHKMLTAMYQSVN